MAADVTCNTCKNESSYPAAAVRAGEATCRFCGTRMVLYSTGGTKLEGRRHAAPYRASDKEETP